MAVENQDRWDGGETRFREAQPRGEDDAHDATENTGLLGAGAGASEGHGWTGLDDFEGLPWWKRPSPWFLLGPFGVLTLAFGGSLVPRMNLIVALVCQRYFTDRASHDPSLTVSPILLGEDNPQCFIPAVQRGVAEFVLVINVITGLLSAVSAPQLGALSDRYGRKRLMVLSSLGGLASEIITILTATFPDALHYNWLVLGAVFDGLAGSFTAGSLLSHAYVSDCTPPSRRSIAYGYMHACLFIGLAFGPLLAAFLVEQTGSLLSIFYVALACHLAYMLFIWFVVPESLSRKRQAAAREKHARESAALVAPALPRPAARVFDTLDTLLSGGGSSSSDSGDGISSSSGSIVKGKIHDGAARLLAGANLFAPLRILWPAGTRNRPARRNLLALALIDMVILGTAMSTGPVMILYVEAQFGWRTPESSRYVSLLSLVRVFILVAIFPVVDYFFRARSQKQPRVVSQAEESSESPLLDGSNGDDNSSSSSSSSSSRSNNDGPPSEKNAGADRLDIWVLRTALLSECIGVAGYVFARTAPAFIAFGVMTSFGGLGSATIQSAITKHVPAERVGQLLGALGLINAMARVWSPLLFNGIYAVTVESFPQAFFVLLSGMFGLALLLTVAVRPFIFIQEPVKDDDHALLSPTAAARSDSFTEDVLEDEQFAPGM